EIDSALRRRLEDGIGGHSVGFANRDRSQPMRIHAAAETPVSALLEHQVLERSLDIFAIEFLRVFMGFAGTEERKQAKRGRRDVVVDAEPFAGTRAVQAAMLIEAVERPMAVRRLVLDQ